MATTQTARRPSTATPERDAVPGRRSHPPAQYWDYRTACWQTTSPVPVPRRGE